MSRPTDSVPSHSFPLSQSAGRGRGEGDLFSKFRPVSRPSGPVPRPVLPGIFFSYSEKGSPSPAGILFSFPAGILSPARGADRSASSPVCTKTVQPLGSLRPRTLWSTLRVVNYLLKALQKVVDHTTPGFCDELLTSADGCVSARNHSALLPRRAIPSPRNGPYLNFTSGRIERESRVSMRV